MLGISEVFYFFSDDSKYPCPHDLSEVCCRRKPVSCVCFCFLSNLPVSNSRTFRRSFRRSEGGSARSPRSVTIKFKMPLMSGASGGVSLSDEAAVKTRLLFDGDGTGEERRLNVLYKSVQKIKRTSHAALRLFGLHNVLIPWL